MKKNKNKKVFGVIYSAECKITGKYYIGATTDSIHQRKLDHEERAKRGETYPFAQAIATYGNDAFIWEQVDTANTIDELAEKEVDIIAKLNSKDSGYNNDRGGGIKKTVYQYNISDGSLVNKYNSLENAANAVNANKTCIGNACLKQSKTCKGFYWSYNLSVPFKPNRDFRKKQVIKYSLSGTQIAVYDSVADASRASGISKTCIARVCRNERKQSGGFLWQYLADMYNIKNDSREI